MRLASGSPRRDLKRDPFRTLGDNGDIVRVADMEAEREGRIARPKGAGDRTPGVHAKGLWQEGKLEGRSGVTPVEGDGPSERWRRFVYDRPDDHVLRGGQIAGDREKAERAARAAIAVMGGLTGAPGRD